MQFHSLPNAHGNSYTLPTLLRYDDDDDEDDETMLLRFAGRQVIDF